MARFLSTANRVVAALSESTTLRINGRGYAAAAEKSTAVVMRNKSVEGLADPAPSSTSWVPDPVTGCYRPANRGDEVDPAELRAMLLSSKLTH